MDTPTNLPGPYRKRRRTHSVVRSSDDTVVDLEPSASSKETIRQHRIMCIDLGTTFSCIVVHYHDQDRRAQTHAIRGYQREALHGRNIFQIPTEVWYPTRSTSDGIAASRMSSASSSTGQPAHMQFDDMIPFGHETTVVNPGEHVRPGFLAGFEPQDMLRREDCNANGYRENRYLTRMKLLLDTTSHRAGHDSTQMTEFRRKMATSTKVLKSEKLINKPEDIIRDFLIAMLSNAKRVVLEELGWTDLDEILFVITAPVCWKPDKNAVMSAIVTDALQRVGFGSAIDGDVPDLFMANEAEASAAFVVKSGDVQLNPHEVIVVVDCGGGTIDGGTYRVSSCFPVLRLGEPIQDATGRNIGGSHINEKVEDFIMEQLKDETYLVDRKYGVTISSLVKKYIMPYFEIDKYEMDFRDNNKTWSYPLPGLRPKIGNERLTKNYFKLFNDDVKGCFNDTIMAVEEVLGEQIEGAKKKGIDVDVAVVIGGFSASPALRRCVKRQMDTLITHYRNPIRLRWASTQQSPLATAWGGTLRAMDMTDGPDRMIWLSVGLLRDYSYEGPEVLDKYPELWPIEAQKKACKRNPYDNTEEVQGVIEWILEKGQGPIDRVAHVGYINSMYAFLPGEKTWEQTEVIYVSDICNESLWRVQHEKNKDKVTQLGTLKLDLTFIKGLRGANQAPLERPQKGEGRPHYPVTVLIQCTVIGRNIKFEVRYPPKKHVRPFATKAFSLVAAFPPGTE